jgi:hypothetical protein
VEKESCELNIAELHEEINNILLDIKAPAEGGHLWEPYQKVAAYLVRLIEIHNQLAWREITGETTPAEKKFRTMIVDKSIEVLEKVASYESRKITARKIEMELDR